MGVFNFNAMKTLITCLITLNSFYLFAQLPEEIIADKACENLQNLTSYEHIDDSIKAHIIKATTQHYFSNKKNDLPPKAFTVEAITERFLNTHSALIKRCPSVRALIIQRKSDQFYTSSKNEKANTFFETGNTYLQQNKYKDATKAFKKSIKLDPEFVYAHDHLAITYRKQDLFKKAIGTYNKSLKIFPEGNLALLNLAAIYTLQGKEDKAQDTFLKLRYLYPKDPEGYFGLAKLLILKRQFKEALHNLCSAHLFYAENDSPYLKDSEFLMQIVHSEMDKNGQEKSFMEITKAYNIDYKVE